MRHLSYWLDTVAMPTFPPLAGDATVDVCVVGGGITGLTTALLCARAGLTVLVVEARTIGSGVTGQTSAHLTWQTDTRYPDLLSKWGDEQAKLAVGANRVAVDRIEALARDVDCDFARVPGYLYAARPGQERWLDQQAAAAERLGVAFDRVDDVPLPFPTHGALRFDQQARFHPLKYLTGLASKLEQAGGAIVEKTRVLSIDDGEPCVVKTEHGSIRAGRVVEATHSPIGLVLSVQTRVEAFRSYVLSFRSSDALADALYWDSEEPYNYTRVQGDVVIVGGRDHKTGKGTDLSMHFEELGAYVRDRYAVIELVDRWSAQVFEPADGLPYVGRAPGSQHVQVASGFSGNGLTHGTAAAMLMSDGILGRENPWTELFRPTRGKVLAGVRRIVHEGIDSVAGLVGRRLSPGEVDDVAQIPSGDGRIVTMGGQKVAAYRDTGGALHLRSAVCTHAGCIVGWNDAENSWDCPCHGGRYTCMGDVLDGPPTRGLAVVETATADAPGAAPAVRRTGSLG
jgi:glycine/D-amino acid oxidase-like deaminating enzyme/nitrite reductase/ring-hydroxylating ferredoxin subunit